MTALAAHTLSEIRDTERNTYSIAPLALQPESDGRAELFRQAIASMRGLTDLAA